MMQNQRASQLLALLEQRILVIDGAMGTAIQAKSPQAEDFGGPHLEGCYEHLVLTRPQIVREIHEEYLQAGCDIIETHSFGANPLVLGEYGIQEKAFEINKLAAELARRAAATFSTPQQTRFVAGSLGPTTKSISLTGGVTFQSLQETYYIQANGLLAGGVDYFLLETCQDTRNIKAAILAIEKLFAKVGQKIPIAISGTLEASGTMLAGQSIEALLASVAHLDLLYLGLNCATGPEFMTDPIRALGRLSPFRIACVPNAGLPDEKGCYLETPEMIAKMLARFIDQGWVNLIGGCCGTHAEHIADLVKIATGRKPRALVPLHRSFLSGTDFLEVSDLGRRPFVIGEKTNAIENQKFKTLIENEKFDEASEIGRAQLKKGVQVVELCLAIPGRNELEDMRKFLEISMRKIRAPFLISSPDPQVIELALTYCQGKALIHSGSGSQIEKVAHLAKKYGAALVVEATVGSMESSYLLLTQTYGIRAEDLYWEVSFDTLQLLEWVKQKFPSTKTILRGSRACAGLPPGGSEVFLSIFLHRCVHAGLDLVIGDPESMPRYTSIPEVEKKLAENLINESPNSLTEWITYFGIHPTRQKDPARKLPLLERLSRYIVEGSKEGLFEDLDEALKTLKPLEIIHGPLMAGMDEVGRLFTANQLIVAEVLQSAEVMKTAVGRLENLLEQSESVTRGKVLLATVKGDVHEIGKNLVEIILANNGFKVVDLGTKVPPERLIEAVLHHQPDLIGLSGLLVKSAQQMVITAEDFAKAGITTPVLVGGAALSSNFVDRHIAQAYTTGTVAYAQDAMSGLDLAKIFVDRERFEKFKFDLHLKRSQLPLSPSTLNRVPEATPPKRSSLISILSDYPQPADFELHILRNTPIEQIWNYINPLMLYGRHLGVRGSSVRLLEKSLQLTLPSGGHNEIKEKDPKALQIWEAVQEVKEEYSGTEILKPAALYRFFRASSEGNSLSLYESPTSSDNHLKEVHRFEFQRQRKPDGLCLADYTHPEKIGHLGSDTVAFFVVTVGKGVRELATLLKNRGDYLKSHIIQALALESAEAYAEILHSQIRKAWGFPDAPEMTLMERFQGRYRGKRYSFGYPACPRLDDQTAIWKLLNPNKIGVQLTDGFMMDPEASISAVVFHHPQATYFSVGHHTGDNGYDDNR